MASALTNIILDLLFVLAFDMGVAGVAYATIIAQGVSATLVTITLLRTTACVRLHPRAIRFHWDVLRKIIRVGLPSALQMSITSFSNIFVMSYINQFGADFTSAWAVYNKVDHQVIIAPIQSLSMSNSTFVGQNLGNRNVERAKEGVRKSIFISISITVSLSLIIFAAAPWLVAFFNDKPEVIEYGTWFLRTFSPFLFLIALNNMYTSALRGAGKSRIPMFIMLSSFVVFRQCYMFVVSNFIANDFRLLAMGFPAGWIVSAVLSFIYYKKVGIEKGTLLEEKSSS
jgi:putative MATE family efflux protein